MFDTRLQILQAAAAAAFLSTIGQRAHAQAALETSRTINGFAAGGTSDAICRRVAVKLSPTFATNVPVENRSGASGQLAVTYVKTQPADGSAILQTATSILTIYPHIYKKLPYDPVADLTPASLGCVFDFGFSVGPMVPRWPPRSRRSSRRSRPPKTSSNPSDRCCRRTCRGARFTTNLRTPPAAAAKP